MTGESLAIVVVIFVMQAMLVRADKREVALLALPFLGVPFFYLLGTVVGALFSSIDAEILYPGMVVAGALVGIGGCLFLGHYIKHRGIKTGYLAFGCVFLIAAAAAYLMNLL